VVRGRASRGRLPESRRRSSAENWQTRAEPARASRHDRGVDLEPHLRPVIGSEREPRSPDAEIARHAARQHGVVARRQLVELGIGNRAIDHRVARGRLHVLHRGVFAVGHRVLSSEAAWMAAVLAGGDAAVLSHQSAAALWGVRQSRSGRVPVTAPRHRRSRGRIALHQGQLPEDEVTTHRGIPVTTPPGPCSTSPPSSRPTALSARSTRRRS